MNSDIRILRGISIATLVFSILGALVGGAFLAMMISVSSMVSDPTFSDLLVQELQSSSSGSAAFDGNTPATTYDFSSMNEQQILEAATLGFNVLIAMAVGYLLLHVVGVVASIMSLRAIDAPGKLGRAFGWTIAAAVCTALVFSIITCVCFIIAAWLNSRIRKSFATSVQGGYSGPGGTYQGGMYQGGMPQAGGYGQSPYGQQGMPPSQQQPGQQQAGQPMPQQPMPQQPAPAPQQPGQPVAQQPGQPAPQQPTPAPQPGPVQPAPQQAPTPAPQSEPAQPTPAPSEPTQPESAHTQEGRGSSQNNNKN